MAELKELLCRSPLWSLAVAESVTCGRVQALVGGISGASEFFAGGITAYSLGEKVRHLDVNRCDAEPVNCVSARVAEQMAMGVCRLFDAQIGLATTGYAEPSPSFGVVHPFAWWAVHLGAEGRTQTHSGRVEFAGLGRVPAQQAIAEAAVAELVRILRRSRV